MQSRMQRKLYLIVTEGGVFQCSVGNHDTII
jgi:hypothetical protein